MIWDGTEKDATLRRMWSEGASSGEIAEALRVTRNMVIGRVDRLTKSGDLAEREEDPSNATVVRMWRDGASRSEIAAAIGSSPEALKSRIRRLIEKGLIEPRPKKVRRGKPVHHSDLWTGTSKDETLRCMWRSGATMRAISEAIGETPGAVSGRIQILQKSGDLQPRGKRKQIVKNPRLVAVKALPEQVETVSAAPTDGIGFFDLSDRTCKFPLWPHGATPALSTMRFCGTVIECGETYCGAHARLAYQAPAERTDERKAA